MKDDLISRQAAIDAINRTGLTEDEKDTVQRVIEQLSSAQPERKTGRWILDNLNNGYGMVYHCTECNWLTTNPQYAYCPNCGAKMEK